jgi:hypothetical protein
MRTTLADAGRPGAEIGSDRREALERCRARLARDGFTVSVVVGGPGGHAAGSPDLMAANGSRLVRVLVLLDQEIDAPQTRGRVRRALRDGETWVWVPWPLRWRALSNLDRWGLRGAAVTGW